MDLEITKEFVLNEDLEYIRDILFKEDSEGHRYRERIMKTIEEIGIKEWFTLRGLPIENESVWLNRYCKTETTLESEIDEGGRWGGFERRAYFLWENYLPFEAWCDKWLHREYKEQPKLSQWF